MKRKLTESEVVAIRETFRQREIMREKLANMTNRALAKKYGVSKGAIEKIAEYKSYRWVR